MRSGITLLAGVALVLGTSIAAAQQTKSTGTDPDPWHIAKVTKLNVARPGGDAAAEAGPQKYLHIEVNFTATPDAQKKHKFRVVNARGEEAGELWGWNDSRSLVIFEGQWGSLDGLYLDGIGHREPLFATAKPPAGQVAQLPATPPGKTLPRVVENGPRTTYVPATEREVVGGDRVIVTDNPDRVVVREGGADRIVVHHHGGDKVVVRDGTTTHVDVNDGPKVTHVYDKGNGGGSGSGAGSDSGSGSGKDAGDAAGSGKGGEAGKDGKGSDKGDEACEDGKDGKDANKNPASDSDKGKCPLGDKCPCGKDCRCGSNCPCGSKAQTKDDGQGDKSDSPPKDSKADSKASGKGQGEGAGSGKGDEPCDDSKGSGSGQASGKSPGKGTGSGSGSSSGKGEGPCDDGDCPPGMAGNRVPGSPGMRLGAQPGMGPVASLGGIKDLSKPTVPPAFVLYISTGEETSAGKVYQVNENGRVLGWVNLPYTATGMALHRTNGLVVAIPRDGGKIMRIDDTGNVATIIEKDKTLVHPVDVAIAGDSDTIVVADNISDVLAATSTEGVVPKVYQRFVGQKWTAQDMSVAVTTDKHVIFGTDGDAGIYRYAGDAHSAAAKPLLPANGGVAADNKSLRWAAAQASNLIYVFEGEELLKKLRLPPGKSFYRNGLLSFSPADSLCVAVRNSDEAEGEVWILMYDVEKDAIRSLFPWNKERMTDFVVGPRMLWDRKSPNASKSIY